MKDIFNTNLLIIILCIVIVYLLIKQSKESFSEPNPLVLNPPTDDIVNFNIDPTIDPSIDPNTNENVNPNIYNGIYKPNKSYYEDDQFKYNESNIYVDTTIYPNKDNINGIVNCQRECNGNCVEFGLTGNAVCFPK